MKNFVALSFFCTLVVSSLSEKVAVKDCGSKLGTIVEVDISSCAKIPCTFKRDTNITVDINFTAKGGVTEAKNSVHGYIAGVPVPFPLSDENACHDMSCPITTGQSVTYKNSVYVKPVYPEIVLIVKWEIVSGSDDVICFTVPVQITS